MITIEQSTAVGRDDGRVFYLAMSLLLSGITAYGFAQTVPTDLAPPGLPFLLKLHAVIFIVSDAPRPFGFSLPLPASSTRA